MVCHHVVVVVVLVRSRPTHRETYPRSQVLVPMSFVPPFVPGHRVPYCYKVFACDGWGPCTASTNSSRTIDQGRGSIGPSHVPACKSSITTNLCFFFSDVLFVFKTIYRTCLNSTCSVDSPVPTYKLDIKVLNPYDFISPSASSVVSNGFMPFVA